MSRFEPTPDGGLRVTLSSAERDLLRDLPDELRGLYQGDVGGDPVRGRLFPRAYLDPTQEEAEQEWQALVHPDLLRGRLEALRVVAESLDAAETAGGRVVVVLVPDAVQAWLGVLNDARLALGTRLEVTEDTDYDDLDPDDPASPGLAAYAWLTFVEGELVEMLLGGGPAGSG